MVINRDLQTRILALQRKTDEVYGELQKAQFTERGIWDRIGDLFGLVPRNIDQRMAEKIFLEKYAAEYDAALKESHRLCDEWMTLIRQCSELEKQELGEMERETGDGGK